MNKKSEMSQSKNLSVPKLAEPGAGIGMIEMGLLKAVIKPISMRGLHVDRSIKKLKQGECRLENELSQFNPERLTERILVPRIWFIEDSSRFWSAAMLFRHISKVNLSIAKAIEYKMSLGDESAAAAKERLKAVKPEMESNQIQEIENFRVSVKRLIAAVQKTSELELQTNTLPHPWFGQLTYAEWTWFAGFHMCVHSRQLKLMKAKAKKGLV